MPILAAKPRHLVFDMARVTFADCASARLITHAGRYPTAGREPLVKDPVPVVRRIFEVAGFADHCEMTGWWAASLGICGRHTAGGLAQSR